MLLTAHYDIAPVSRHLMVKEPPSGEALRTVQGCHCQLPSGAKKRELATVPGPLQVCEVGASAFSCPAGRTCMYGLKVVKMAAAW